MMEQAPRDEELESLLDQAESSLEQGELHAALALCEQALVRSPGHAGAHFVRGDTLRVMGDLPAARDAYRAASLSRPDHASSWASLALASFEMLDMAEALRASDRAVREDPANPEGWWVRGLVHEFGGNAEGATRHRLHARWLDPMGYPLPPTLSDEDVETLVVEALEYLHPDIRGYLTNVAIMLEELPEAELLAQYDPPASPLELLGYFSGHSLMDRSLENPWSMLPPTIVLFRKNLERHAADRAELIEQLRVTLFHEIGHFLGLDEDDLERRGLE